MASDPDELALADTIGVATPTDVLERVGAVRHAFPDIPIRLHLHNTRNTGIANAWAGLMAGAVSLDCSIGGVGGSDGSDGGVSATTDGLETAVGSPVASFDSVGAFFGLLGWQAPTTNNPRHRMV